MQVIYPDPLLFSCNWKNRIIYGIKKTAEAARQPSFNTNERVCIRAQLLELTAILLKPDPTVFKIERQTQEFSTGWILQQKFLTRVKNYEDAWWYY